MPKGPLCFEEGLGHRTGRFQHLWHVNNCWAALRMVSLRWKAHGKMKYLQKYFLSLLPAAAVPGLLCRVESTWSNLKAWLIWKGEVLIWGTSSIDERGKVFFEKNITFVLNMWWKLDRSLEKKLWPLDFFPPLCEVQYSSFMNYSGPR